MLEGTCEQSKHFSFQEKNQLITLGLFHGAFTPAGPSSVDMSHIFPPDSLQKSV